MDKRRFRPCFRSLRSDPTLNKSPRKPKRTPSLNKMYLETKIAMLEIVQEGLQLKLDMQCAKEEFIGILEGYHHNYENYDQFDYLFNTHELNDSRVPPVDASHTRQHRHPEDHASDPRARVKALYEARKARMNARRDKLDTMPSTSFSKPPSWQGLQYTYAHPEEEREQSYDALQTPVLSICSESDKEEYFDFEDRNNNTPTKSPRENFNYQLHEESSCSIDPPYANTLSTITEENSPSSKNSSGNNPGAKTLDSESELPQIPPRCPLIPKNRYKEYLSDKVPPKPSWQDLGEYVTLKIPNKSMVSFSDSNIVQVQSDKSMISFSDSNMGQAQSDTSMMSFSDSNMGSAPSMLKPDMITQSFGGSMFSLIGTESNVTKRDCDSCSKESAVRYAKSNVISELYTSQKRERSNLDISYISNISSTSSPSGGTVTANNSSDYPFHSTMIGAHTQQQNLQLSFSETDEDSLMNRTDDTLESVDTIDGDCRTPHDTRTTVSEPILSPHTSRLGNFKAFDDCYINAHKDKISTFKTPNNPIPSSRIRKGTPKQTQIPQLCSEHGLHLNYGGPCIFEDSFDQLGSSGESDLDFSSVNFNSEYGSKLGSKRSSVASKRSSVVSKISSKRSSVIHHNSAVDTDCDSSYLSECVDDTHFTNDFSEAENYTALYDSRNARMKMLRRQTGQGNIKRQKKPIGLSDSDFLHDMTAKHLSLQATRSSMPDIYNLSPTSSTCSGADQGYTELLETSMHDSTLKSHADEIPYKESDDEHSVSLSHNETIISCDMPSNVSPDDIDSRSEQRPVSLCTSTTGTTTTDDSPESNGGMSVPVNSPNITDSGGSSSRPTTDTYDYVDVPINIPKVAQLLKSKLTLQQQPHLHPPYHQQSRSMQSIPNSQSGKIYAASCTGSHRSHRSHQSQAQTTHSDPVLHPLQDEHKSKKYPLKYPRSQDSGFATHESGRSHPKNFYQPRSHSYDALQPDGSAQSRHVHSKQRPHIAISDQQGITRNVVQHSAVARNLNKDRKKALARRFKQFSNNFYSSNGSQQIKTLAHI